MSYSCLDLYPELQIKSYSSERPLAMLTTSTFSSRLFDNLRRYSRFYLAGFLVVLLTVLLLLSNASASAGTLY
jgi:hypothetical protein